MLPLPALLIIFAIAVVILLLLLVIAGAGRFTAWWSKRALAGKMLVAGLLAIVVGGLAAAWIYQGAIAEQWNWTFTIKPYRTANFDPYVLTAERERALKPLDVFRECAQGCPEMVVIPAGRFKMGSSAAKAEGDGQGRQHDVTIARPFAVAKFDVTFPDWDACVEFGGCQFVDLNHVPWDRDSKKFPAGYVNWYDAHTYVAWLSRMTGKTYRLLTEAEWEYAARAGTTTTYYWGENCEWCTGTFKPELAGLHRANAFGLYDMSDNVEQWVEDCWHSNYDGAPTDGSAWLGGECDTKVARGGGGDKNYRRVAHRIPYPAEQKANDVGFRIARTLAP
jgi:formylglycine-generating enzyme required for sulfatase activity